MVETDKREGDELTAWQAHSRTADSEKVVPKADASTAIVVVVSVHV